MESSKERMFTNHGGGGAGGRERMSKAERVRREDEEERRVRSVRRTEMSETVGGEIKQRG